MSGKRILFFLFVGILLADFCGRIFGAENGESAATIVEAETPIEISATSPANDDAAKDDAFDEKKWQAARARHLQLKLNFDAEKIKKAKILRADETAAKNYEKSLAEILRTTARNYDAAKDELTRAKRRESDADGNRIFGGYSTYRNYQFAIQNRERAEDRLAEAERRYEFSQKFAEALATKSDSELQREIRAAPIERADKSKWESVIAKKKILETAKKNREIAEAELSELEQQVKAAAAELEREQGKYRRESR